MKNKYFCTQKEEHYVKIRKQRKAYPSQCGASVAQDNETLKQKLQEAGQDPSQLDQLKNVELSSDRIAVPAGMIGTLALRIIEREENKTIKFETEQSPVQANMWIQVLPTSELTTADGQQGTKMRLTLKADLNPMLKMMLGKKLEQGIEKFADMLAMLPY